MRWTKRAGREPRGRHRAAVPGTGAGPAPPVLTPMWSTPAGSGVYLGFDDGSLVELAPADPRVGTFRAVARTLTEQSEPLKAAAGTPI